MRQWKCYFNDSYEKNRRYFISLLVEFLSTWAWRVDCLEAGVSVTPEPGLKVCVATGRPLFRNAAHQA